MFKFSLLTLAAVSGLAVASSFAALALAQTQLSPTDPNNGPTDPCMKKAYKLAEVASQKQLSDANLQKLDGMFDLMAKHCKALELPQADKAAAEIKAFIDTAK